MNNNCEEYIEMVGIEKILNMLPHRYPFLLVDKVLVQELGKSGIGKKNVTINEPYFTGHFPEHPIVPGALIIESVAQTIAVVYNSKYMHDTDITNLKEHIGYLGAVNMKFLHVVLPGDTMSICVELESKIRNISSFQVVVYVDKKIVAKGSVTVTEH